MNKKRKKIISKKIYKVECTEYSDGSSKMTRTCDGFNLIEILGLTTLVQLEVMKQIKGTIKPDIIERKVIVRK